MAEAAPHTVWPEPGGRPGGRGSGEGEDPFAALARAVAAAAAADVVVVRTLLPEGSELIARAASSSSATLAAEIEGSRIPSESLPATETDAPDAVPAPLRRLAARAGAGAVLCVPARVGGVALGSLELARAGAPFGERERETARLGAAQLALGLLVERNGGDRGLLLAAQALEVAAEPLAGEGAERRAAERIAWIATAAAGAAGARLWAVGGGDAAPEILATAGTPAASPLGHSLPPSQRAVVERAGDGTTAVVVRLGEPALGALELHFDASAGVPDAEALIELAGRAAQSLRAVARTTEIERELGRTRALLGAVGEAIAELSLAHALETAVERVAELLGIEAVGVYLRTRERLFPAAGSALAGPHDVVAERLLGLALGPLRARGAVSVSDAVSDERLASVRDELERAEIAAAHAVPLLAHGDVIGLLAVYPERGRALAADEAALFAALAAQLAVAVQNARLHEQLKERQAERERALAAERAASRQLRALYEISQSFAHSLSLDATLNAVGRALVGLLAVDVAVIRLPGDRGDAPPALSIHVADQQLRAPMHAVFAPPDEVSPAPIRRMLAAEGAIRLDLERAAKLGGAYALLGPFLEKGATAAVLPIATSDEVLATLTLVSLNPGLPISAETIGMALPVARQAALAVDNARLYAQQKEFADTMQRSLLPRTRPRIDGLELGEAYESAARVDVGGDVYDFVTLDERTLAVVLGDVTGHGIDAAADMAMAKFVFRSLARAHPEPDAFLAATNAVVVEEIAPGKFITMLYVLVDIGQGLVACASAGHPPPRFVNPDGTVDELPVRGLALGIDETQAYEAVRREFPPGSKVVLYTDGVIEARRGRELYGCDRLDRLVGEQRELDPRDLALAVLADCRRFAGGELRDDCAVVVLERTA